MMSIVDTIGTGHSYSTVWYLVFLGGIALFHRVNERNCRDTLENVKEELKTLYELDTGNPEGLAKNIHDVNVLQYSISKILGREIAMYTIVAAFVFVVEVVLSVMRDSQAIEIMFGIDISSILGLDHMETPHRIWFFALYGMVIMYGCLIGRAFIFYLGFSKKTKKFVEQANTIYAGVLKPKYNSHQENSKWYFTVKQGNFSYRSEPYESEQLCDSAAKSFVERCAF